MSDDVHGVGDPQDVPADGAGRDRSALSADGVREPVPDGAAAPATGDAAVDEALGVLVGIEQRPVREHLDALDAVHRALQDRLADAEG